MKYKGKDKCRILKQIRAEIAKNNDIKWVTEECTHKGDCRGTCPHCEAEVRELERALAERRNLGKKVAIVGIAAGIALSAPGCIKKNSANTNAAANNTATEQLPETELEGEIAGGTSEKDSETEEEVFMGVPALSETEEEPEIMMGEPALPPETEEEEKELMGDIAEKKEPEEPVLMGKIAVPECSVVITEEKPEHGDNN